MSATNDQCPLCGGQKSPGTTTFTADLGSGVVVVRRVRATIFPNAGKNGWTTLRPRNSNGS